MEITYLKLVNHIPFKNDIELDLVGDKCIMIKGRTGSGKSYLLNSIHPYSNSSRHYKEYAIYPHKRGYKEIRYTDKENEYIIRHEYIPNSKGSHSCKSYFTKNGKELNENGNNDSFKEFVKKYLNYSNEVSNFSLLSVKSSGFIDSTPVNRNNILFSLIESDSMKLSKDNLQSHIVDNNARIKLYKETRDEILYNRNIKEDEETLKMLIADVPILEAKIESLVKEREKVLVDLSVFKERTNIDIKLLESVVKYLNEVNDIIKDNNLIYIKDLIKYINDIELIITKRSSRYSELESERKDLYNKIQQISNYNSIEEKLNKLKTQKIDIEKNISEYIKLEKIKDIHTISNDINTINRIKSSVINLGWTLKDKSDLEKFKSSLLLDLNNCKQTLEIIKQTKRFKDLIDSEHSILCPNCKEPHPILKNIFDNLKEISDERIINEKMIDLERNLDIVSKIESKTEEIYNSLVDSEILSDKFISKNYLESYSLFLEKNIFGNHNITESFNNLCNYGLTQYNRLLEEIKEYSIKLSMLTKCDGVLENEMSKLKEKEIEINNLKTEMNRDYCLLNHTKTDLNLTEFSNMTITEVRDLEEQNKDINKTLEDFNTRILDLDSKYESTQNILKKSNNDIVYLSNIVDRFNEVYEKLSIYSNKKKDLDLIKDILYRDIPKIILNGNIRYMEDTINTILTQNSIDMTLSFNTDDKNGIIIPVYINSKEVPDARALSSGETSLLSTLINTSLLSLLGYKVLLIDELDAHLDTVYREVFGKIISSICQILDIDQVFFISHNINIENADKIITVGDVEQLDIDKNKKIVRI